MSWLQAVLLGALQGLTEFLPVSSSGHLVLAEQGMRQLGGSAMPAPQSEPMLLFDLSVHVGTLAAIIAVFAPQLRRYLRSLVAQIPRVGRLASARPPGALYITALGVVACIPTAGLGLYFKDWFETAFGRPGMVGLGLLVSGALLVAAELRPRPVKGFRRFGVGGALLVGLAQGVAIAPGISRSGATICVALLCGLRRRWAGQFSFLIAAPAIVGGSAIKLAEVLGGSAGRSVAIGPIVVGAVVAGVVGYVALRLLLSAIQRARLHYFGYYCWVVGLVAILGSWAGWL